jgi:hypothetical protein
LRRKKFSRGFRGWILAELLCCVTVAAIFSALLVQTASLVAKMSVRTHDEKILAEDYASLSHEIDSWAASEDSLTRGKWRAEIFRRDAAGCREADVAVEKSADGRPVTVRWKLWDIKGRK